MKYFFLYLLLFFSSLNVATANENGKCNYHYFRNGKVSTEECYDKDHRFGKARAYDVAGRLIYEKEVRRIAGSASVEFTYYDNGAVKQAHWHSAPDGGIQWYNTTTNFSEDGKVTGETENNYDHSPSRTIQQHPKQTLKSTPDSHTAYCAVIYSSEFWFTNTTYFAVTISATRGVENFTATLKPGETMKGGQVILAEQFDTPDKYYKFSVSPANKKLKERPVIIPSDRKPQQSGKTIRRYYFEVRRIV